MSSYLKRIIGRFDTTLEIFKPFFSLDTWTLGHSVWNCQGLFFTLDTWTLTLKFSGSFFLWTLGHMDTGPKLKFLDSFLHWTLGHSVWNSQGLFFTLDTWTLTLKFSGSFFLCTLGHWVWNFWDFFSLDTWTLGHWAWNFWTLFFFGHLDTWTLTLKFSGSFFLWTLGHLDTGPEIFGISSL